MDLKNSLQYLYRDEHVDIKDVYRSELIDLFFMDLEYVEGGKTIKIKPFPISELSSFEDLAYYQKNWDNHVQAVYNWMDWFQKYVSSITEIDEEWIKEQEQERWDDNEDEHGEYDSFEDFWEGYQGSSEYYDEVNFHIQQAYNNLTNEFEDEYKIIDSIMGNDEWFDSYDRLYTRKMDNALDEITQEISDHVDDFLSSEYDIDDFDEEGLKEHFDEIFE